MKSTYTKLALLAVMLFSGIASVSADNVLSISTGKVIPGGICTVSVNLENSDPVSGMNMDIVLPEGLAYVEGSFARAEERVYNHTVMTSTPNEGKNVLRVGIFPKASNPKYSAFLLNEGTIFTFNVRVHTMFNSGVISFENVDASDGTAATGIPVALEVETEPANLLANAGTFELVPNDTIALAHDTLNAIGFALNNTTSLVGLETVIVLPENTALAMNEYEEPVVILSDRCSPNTELMCNNLGDGRYKLVLSSLTNDEFKGTDGVLFTVNLVTTGDIAEGACLTFENVLVSNIVSGFSVSGLEGADSVFFYSDATLAYERMSAELDGLSAALAAAIDSIATNYDVVKEQFTGAEIAAAIDSVQAELDANKANFTRESNIDEFVAATTAAIEKLIADAAVAYEAAVTYAKLSAEVAALDSTLASALDSIANNYATVADQFKGEDIAAAIDSVQNILDTKKDSLTYESNIDEFVAAVNAAIEKLIADAKFAFEADATYNKLTAEVAALDSALAAAIDTIAANYASVADQFTGAEIAAAIDSVQAVLDANKATLTPADNIDEFAAATTAAIEKLVADAKFAFEADATYNKLSAEIAALEAKLAAAIDTIAANYPLVAADFTGNEIAEAIDSVKAELDANKAALTPADNIDEFTAATEAAIEEMIAAAKAANESMEAYIDLSAELVDLDSLLNDAVDSIAAKYPEVAADFTGEDIAASIDSVQTYLNENLESLTAESNIDEFTAETKARIEKLLADAKYAYDIVTGIDDVDASIENAATIYNVNGVKRSKTAKGLNIVVNKDGSSKIVIAN